MKNKFFRIKGASEYFYKKYGTYSPLIKIEGRDIEVWGKNTFEDEFKEGNISCILFKDRIVREKITITEVYYGKLANKNTDERVSSIEFGELVDKTELEEVDINSLSYSEAKRIMESKEWGEVEKEAENINI